MGILAVAALTALFLAGWVCVALAPDIDYKRVNLLAPFGIFIMLVATVGLVAITGS